MTDSRAQKAQPVVEVEHVTLRRGERTVLQDVTFDLLPGENVALLGANGSGKTTLVHLLNGTLVPESGRVRVGGMDTADTGTLVDVRRRVGLLFQDPDNQFVTTTAEREIAFGLENLQLSPEVIGARVQEALVTFDLERYRQTPPHEMSGGEKARLAVASVWVMGADVLVLDETESLLDRPSAERLETLIATLPPETVVVRVTTEAERAAEADRVLVLDAGRLIADAAPDVVWSSLPEAVVASVGLPLVWRLSRELRARGHDLAPTGSWNTLRSRLHRGADRHA